MSWGCFWTRERGVYVADFFFWDRRVSKRDPVDPFRDDAFLRYCREMELDTTGEMRREFDKVCFFLLVLGYCMLFSPFYGEVMY